MGLNLRPNDPQKAKAYFEDKMAYTTGPAEVRYAQESKYAFTFVDVRAAKDFEEEHPVGAINLPESEWGTFRGLTKDKLNVLSCYSQQCHLATRAAIVFASAGYPVMELEGGFEAWKEHEEPVETGKGRAA